MNKTNLIVIFSLLALSAIIGFVYLNFFIVFPVTADAEMYDEGALNLLAGKGLYYQVETDKMIYPGYPVFLALIYKVFGHDYNAVRFIQFLLVGGVAILVYLLGSHFKLNRISSLLAALTVLVWPYFIVHSTIIYTEILYTFFLISAVFFLLKFIENQSHRKTNAVFSGLFLGLTALTRSEALLLPFFILFLFWLFFRIKPSKSKILILLIFILVLLPWLVPGLLHHQAFFSKFGWAFQCAWFTAYPEFYNQSDYQFNLSYFLKSQITNFISVWNPGCEGLRAQALAEKFPWTNNLFLAYKIFFFLILGFAFLSWRFIKRKGILLLWAPVFYLWLVFTVMYHSPRHTLAIMPLVILLAFISFQYIFNRVKFKNI